MCSAPPIIKYKPSFSVSSLLLSVDNKRQPGALSKMRKQASNKAGKQKVHVTATDSSSQQMLIPPPLSSPLNHHQAPSIPSSLQPINSQPRPAPKVAIPRLRRGSEDHNISEAAATGDKHRVTHACEPYPCLGGTIGLMDLLRENLPLSCFRGPRHEGSHKR